MTRGVCQGCGTLLSAESRPGPPRKWCADCKKARKVVYNRDWNKANEKKLAARKHAHYEAHREQIAARHRAWREANRESAAAHSRAWRERQKGRVTRCRDCGVALYNGVRPGRLRITCDNCKAMRDAAQDRAYYVANREREVARQRAWREANPGYHRSYEEAQAERIAATRDEFAALDPTTILERLET